MTRLIRFLVAFCLLVSFEVSADHSNDEYEDEEDEIVAGQQEAHADSAARANRGASLPDRLRPPAARSSSGLVAPGTGGNPGWQYHARNPGRAGSNFKCGATLVAAPGSDVNAKLCVAITADHCIENALQNGQIVAEIPGGGEVRARVFRNRDSKVRDAAVFAWDCPKGAPAGMPVVPVRADRLSENQSVLYGKVMGADVGLHAGRVFRGDGVTRIDGIPVGDATEQIAQTPGKKTVQGDSGSPLLVRESGRLYLVGVLSTGDDITKNRDIGGYSVATSLAVVADALRALR